MFAFDATTREILEQAIRNEITTQVYLDQLTRRVRSDEGRQTMQDLARRKHGHRSHFERRFHEMFGESSPDIPEPRIETPDGMASIELSKALRLALERERDLESNWRFLAEQVPPGDARTLLLELAETQWRFREEVRQIQGESDGQSEDILDF